MEKSSKSLWPIPPDCFIWGLTSLNVDNAKINVITVLCWLCGLARFGEKRNHFHELIHGLADGLINDCCTLFGPQAGKATL